ncbi:MAG: GNAT family N-acetyltransferase [Legionellales bacterium]|jgi:[ribosomal protein S5]-alanine N-acetyltransferase|nr:GNAT family N-acetyltransferase [Legionellales bacterium]
MIPTFPKIQVNKDIYLREISEKDAARYYKYITHEKVKQFVPINCLPNNEAKALSDLLFLINLYKLRRGIYWAIATKNDDQLIGTCGYETWHKNHARLELVYDLDPNFWGKNIMHLALEQIINFAFSNMPINRIEAVTTPDNDKSKKVLQKLNFTEEGILRQYRYYKYNFTDVCIFSILREEHKLGTDILTNKDVVKYLHGN